jgi:Cof subfamily protein (haloacid dehalogenase superfamily)
LFSQALRYVVSPLRPDPLTVGLVRALMTGRFTQTEPIAALLADVDGILPTGDRVLTPRMIEAVTRLRDRGVMFCIASSRPPLALGMFADSRLTTAIAALNGGVLIRPDLSVIDEEPLPVEIPLHVIDILRAHRVEAWVHSAANWYVTDPLGTRVDRETALLGFPPVVVPHFDDLCHAVIRIVGVNSDHYAIARCEASVRAEFGPRVTVWRSQPYSLDVMHPRANKGAVVQRLARYLDVSPQRIATIGHQMNDSQMFKESGLSIAMGNAAADVRRRATFVAPSSGEEGFVDAVDRFILPRTQLSNV